MLIETVALTGSTNDDLLKRAAEGSPEGLWLRAERQTGGKGRQGRAWVSPAGNLYASTLVRLRPVDPPAPSLALVAAVALHEVASAFAPGLTLKWPNDLMAGPAKVAGILLERAGEAVVIGFGANLAHHPQGLERPVASLASLGGMVPDPAIFTTMLAERLADNIARWRAHGIAPVRPAWLDRAHPVGTTLTTAEGDGSFDGLDETGALRLRRADGIVVTITAGDVFVL